MYINTVIGFKSIVLSMSIIINYNKYIYYKSQHVSAMSRAGIRYNGGGRPLCMCLFQYLNNIINITSVSCNYY